MKAKTIKLTPSEKQGIWKWYSNLHTKKKLLTASLIKTLEDFQKRFVKMANECDSISSEFFSKPIQDLLIVAAKQIDARMEVLAGIFRYNADQEFLPWDELRCGPYLLNIVIVQKAQILLLKIIHLMSQKELNIPALLSLCFKLGMFIESFSSITLVSPAKAKLALIDKAKLGGRSSAKLRQDDILQISTWAKDLDTPDKKRKQLYEEVRAKWIAKYPKRKVCVRTIEKYLKLQ